MIQDANIQLEAVAGTGQYGPQFIRLRKPGYVSMLDQVERVPQCRLSPDVLSGRFGPNLSYFDV
jgi:hypothetical protein